MFFSPQQQVAVAAAMGVSCPAFCACFIPQLRSWRIVRSKTTSPTSSSVWLLYFQFARHKVAMITTRGYYETLNWSNRNALICSD
jgi:hypothetical protein